MHLYMQNIKKLRNINNIKCVKVTDNTKNMYTNNSNKW